MKVNVTLAHRKRLTDNLFHCLSFIDSIIEFLFRRDRSLPVMDCFCFRRPLFGRCLPSRKRPHHA